MTIKSQRPELSEDECRSIANKALLLRRGKKKKQSNGTFTYSEGTDSDAYNFMLSLANGHSLPSHLSHLKPVKADPNPRTPALGSAMSKAIQYRFCGNDYLTSRANWGIQSTGVDILHILLTCLEYLKEHFKLNYLFMFTYHDETWLVSPEAERYKAALCMQIAHLWTWAFFFKKLGFNDLPWGYQWFSGVNIDKAFRKEPTDSQITPSNPDPQNNPQELKFTESLPNGEVLNIVQLLGKLN
jgi:DNA polymerase gamma 1